MVEAAKKDPAKLERSFVMVKPDGVRRGLVGAVLSRYEQKGLKIVAARLMLIPKELAEKHYEEHKAKPFFGELVRFITSSPVLVMAIEGRNAVQVIRSLNGATKPWEAGPGTIRGDLALSLTPNVVHASDSVATAQRELALYFTEKDYHPYERTDEDYL
ncbi:MAG: nucleoside-diphosphate kinase [Candidatus Thermoplasmatota archaeon]|jgi:nucleoside-diphosphate kinase|nr:nucleoside-diphosphate kinase [Candidatus Thermoplasmatota archaeon]MCL5984518.1 nucleoside-diphosphate kinase [Candidatus Thermoplasmatota archaeon]